DQRPSDPLLRSRPRPCGSARKRAARRSRGAASAWFAACHQGSDAGEGCPLHARLADIQGPDRLLLRCDGRAAGRARRHRRRQIQSPGVGGGGQTFNEVFGTTTNPWDTSRTPGGSSGGAAAALASGQVWLAQGSDLGGSLRTPASFTGVVGLRPSPKRVAHGPLRLPFSTSSVEGPMARNVGETALLLDTVAGARSIDPGSLPAPEISYVDCLKAIPKFGRIAYSPNLGQCPVDPEVAEICAKAAADFARYSEGVDEACPDLHDAEAIFQTLRAQMFIASHAPLLAAHRDRLKPELIWNVEKGARLTADEIGAAQRAQGQLYLRVVEFFSKYDFLLTPAAIVPPFTHDKRYVEEVNGVRFDNYMSWLALPSMLTVTCC